MTSTEESSASNDVQSPDTAQNVDNADVDKILLKAKEDLSLEIEKNNLATSKAAVGDLTLNEQEYAYEEEIIRNPYVVKGWLRYAEYKRSAPPAQLNMIYERAVKQLPGSYKLWIAYLRLRKRQVRGRCITDDAFEDVNNTFERSLVFMFKMPRVWLEYLQFLMLQKKVIRLLVLFHKCNIKRCEPFEKFNCGHDQKVLAFSLNVSNFIHESFLAPIYFTLKKSNDELSFT